MPDPFDFESPSARFAVMGNPVAHSQSPRIHMAFAKQFGLRIEYTKIQVDVGGFPQAVSNFQATGGRGLNITVPFKIEAFRLADELSDRARQAGAVNTLSFGTGGGIAGDNTDGVGLCRDIEANLDCPLIGRRVLVIGAGGAVRGVLGPLLAAGPVAILVANRTADKAQMLVSQFADPRLEACGLNGVGGRNFDVVINGTTASLGGAIPELPDSVFATCALAYDMMYGEAAGAFLTWARERGARRAADGLGMLVEQAAESFFIWHEKQPATGPVLRALRAAH